ncbi:MAG: gliding motility-associated C-terminal domain-containing protein [Flavipsychrobacter sp.]|nr:gliding motility-associated C-terminal domain-containing protein [Flavipsychrobacter sp.]
MKQLYNRMFEPIKNVCRKSVGRGVILAVAALFSSQAGWAQTPTVSLAGPACAPGTITLTSSIQPAQITWQLGGVTQTTATGTWGANATTIAGGNGNGNGLNQLALPAGIFRDAAGNTYIADQSNNRIIEFAAGSTSASSGTVVAGTGASGSTSTTLNAPSGVAVDALGNIYVADQNNQRIQKFPSGSTSGTAATTVAGTGTAGSGLSQLSSPTGLALDASGNIYVSDYFNYRVIKFPSGSTSGTNGTIVAGGNGNGNGATQLAGSDGICLDASGNLYVTDPNNNRVQKFASGSTSATSGTTVAGGNGAGTATNQLNYPSSVAVDGLGNIYVADANNNRVQKWPSAAVAGTTVAGSAAGTSGSTAALLNFPTGVVIDGNGNLFVSDFNNNRIQQFAPTIPLTFSALTPGSYTAIVTTYTGATATTAPFVIPGAPTVTGPSNQTVYTNANAVFTATATGGGTITYQWQVSTNGGVLYTNITNGAPYAGATTNTLTVYGVTAAMNNYLYRVIATNSTCALATTGTGATLTVLSLTPVVNLTGPSCTTGTLTLTSSIQPATIVWQLNGVTQSTVKATWGASATTIAGGNGAGTGLNQLNGPNSLYRDGSGNIYIAEYLNNRVIEFPSGSTSATSGTIVAGTGTAGSGATQLNGPSGVWVDNAGNIYVSDEGNNRIQKFPAGSTSGTSATTVAGLGVTSLSQLSSPEGLQVDAAGNIYVADQSNNRVMKFPSGSTQGTAGTVVAGGNGSGTGANQLTSPTGIFVTGAGVLYVADFGNNRVQNFGAASTSATSATTVAGGNGSGASANQLNNPTNVFVDGLGNVYVADAYNNRIQQWAPAATTGITVAGSPSATSGSSASLLSLAYTVHLAGGGFIYVSDYNNSRVQLFTPTIPLTYNATVAGTYSAIVTTFGNNSATATYNVTVVPAVTANPVSSTICNGGNTSFTGGGSGSGVTYTWQVSTNGGSTYTPITTNAPPYSGVGTTTLTISGATTAMSGYLYQLVVSGTCTPAVTTTPATLTVTPSTVITTNPASQTICAGGNNTTGSTSFTVAGTGTGTITYQWQVSTNGGATYTPLTDGGIYSGSGTGTLTITGASTAVNGYMYNAVATGGCGTATSTAATLTVNPLPSITGQPAPVTVCSGGNATFTVVSTGGVTYQWQVSTNGGTSYTNMVNGVPTTGATSPILSLSGVTTSMNNNLYRLLITTTNGCSIYSNTALLTVNGSPTVTTAPTNQTVCVGATATFSVVATATGIGYQWQQSTDGGLTYSNVGTNASTYTTPVTTTGMNGYLYNVVISSTTCPSTTSSNALLSVQTPAGTVTVTPAGPVTVCAGTSVTFNSSVASGTTPFAYQWQQSTNGGSTFTNISGATSASYTIASPAASQNSYQFRVVVSGTGACTAGSNSNAVVLNVNTSPTITSGATLTPATICAGYNTTATVVAAGSGLSYQWQVNTGSGFNPITSATSPVYGGYNSASLTITGGTTAMNGYQYNVIVSGTCSPSPVTSGSATLHVNTSPTLTFTNPNPSVCTGTTSTSLSFTGLSGGTGGGVTTSIFGYTGGVQTFTVPANVSSITVDASGAQGGGSANVPTNRAAGGRIQGTLATIPGQVLNIYVGGSGADGNSLGVPSNGGFNGGGTATPNNVCSSTVGGDATGGGGGGATDIRVGGVAFTNRVAVAGGGGGAGYHYGISNNGGIGGGATAGNGTSAYAPEAGLGGSQTAGGAGGTFPTITSGSAGTLGLGGNNNPSESGGGGGGYYGGGGSTGDCGGGGAGGGSDYLGGLTGATSTPGYNSANGYVNLTYTLLPIYTYSIVWSAPAITAGFTNVTNAVFPNLGTVPVTIPGTATVNTYTGTFTINNGTCTTSYPISIIVSGTTVVTTQPAPSTYVCAGGNTTISAAASSGTLSYQWTVSTNNGGNYTPLSNAGVYSGVTTTTLAITGATAGMNGYLYRLSISSPCSGIVVSNPDTLHISPSVSATIPTDVYGCVGSNVTLATATTTGNNLTYQWNVNTGSGFTPLSGATTNPYTLPSVTAGMNGYLYTVTVSGLCGAPVTSNSETLHVSSAIPTPPVAQALINDSVCLNQAFSINLSGGPAGAYYIVNGPNGYTNTTTGSSVFVSGGVTNSYAGAYVVYDSVLGCVSSSVTNTLIIGQPPTIINAGATTASVCLNQPISFFSTVTPSSSPTNYYWQGPINGNPFTPGGSTSLPLCYCDSVDANPGKASAGFVDGGGYTLIVYSAFGSQTCSSVPFPFNVTVNPLPNTPTVLPGNHLDSVCVSSPISLLASSTTGGVSYKWQGPNGAGDVQTTPTYSQTSATFANGGHYSVVAINSSTGCVSLPDTLFLNVKAVPGNPSASSNSPVCLGSTLNLQATSANADSFSWTGPGTPAFSAQVQNPSIISTPYADSGVYIVTSYLSRCASLATASTRVKINPIPSDPTATSNSPLCEGATLNLRALDTTTTAPITYTWTAKNALNPNLHTSNQQNYTISPVQLSDSGLYSVFVYFANGCHSANPATVQVMVNPKPVAPVLTSNSPICAYQNLHLTFTEPAPFATATPIWSGPGIDASNFSLSSVGIPAAPLSDAGVYQAYANYNGCLSDTATRINVVIYPVPGNPTATSNSPICSGSSPLRLFLDTTGAGPGPITYIWSGPGGVSATTKNVVVNNPTTANNGIDSAYVINSYGCKSVLPGTTTVIVGQSPNPPLVTNQTICQFSNPSPLTATGTNLHWYTSPADLVGSTTAPIPNDSLPGIFNYYVTQSTTAGGCESPRATIVITVNQKPAPPYVPSNTITYCQYDGAALLSATGQNLLWYTSASGGVGSPIAPTPSTVSPANYVYYVSQTVNGCESNRTPIVVIVKQKPQPPIVQDISYCQNDAAAPLTAIGQNIRWYNVGYGGVGTPVPPIPQTSYPDTVIYYVTQTVNGCESDRVPQHVYIFYKPNVVIKSPGAYVCQHDTMTFFYFGNALTSAAFDWILPQGATIVSSTSPGTILVRFDSAGNQPLMLSVSNGNCKSSSNTITVQVRPQPIAAISSLHSVCQDDIVVVGLAGETPGTQLYNYNFDGGTIISSASPGGPYNIEWTTPGVHIVTLTTTINNCTSQPAADTVNVHAIPDTHIVSVDAKDLNNVCSGDSVEVSAGLINPGYQYQWSPTQFFKHGNNAPKLYANIDFSASIYLTVTSDFGCVGNDSAYVNIQPCCNLYMPNAFTPNGDNKNDIFHVLTIGHHTIRDFRVVNRWGQTVFQTTDELKGWDGNYNGVPQDMDTYFWYIDYVCNPSGKEIKEQGEVYLVR